MVIPLLAQPLAQPRVVLSTPRLITQGGDLAVSAQFDTPLANGSVGHNVPRDAAFMAKSPSGKTLTFLRSHPYVKVSSDSAQLVFRPREAGDWIIKIQGTTSMGGQQVVVTAEALVHVASSAF